MTLYEKVRYLCKRNGINMKILEKELGFGNGTISRWKTSIPSADRVVKVAKYFNVTTDYLLGLSEILTPSFRA